MADRLVPRIVIAAPASGAGKTTIAAGLMAAFRRRGLAVQPFKAGPDYIDPTFHALAAGRPSVNLDTWLLSAPTILERFDRYSRGGDLAVIEGVMGVFDGLGGRTEIGSTAHLAKMLDAPVLLVVDARASARSAVIPVLGCLAYDRDVRWGGVLLNGIAGTSHYMWARDAIARACRLPVFGYLPHDPGLTLPERHLGLIPAVGARAGKQAQSRRVLQTASRLLERNANLDLILRIARRAPPLAFPSFVGAGLLPRPIRIGLAKDECFHFYYEDNLDLLRRMGAELVPFSPLRSSRLPERLGGIYIGGGFPEMAPARLSHNQSLIRDLRAAAKSGMPIYGECGGMMYLTEKLTDPDGRSHAMAGILPGRTRMTKRLAALGYITARARQDSILARRGESSRGHVFHWSEWEPSRRHARFAFTLEKGNRTMPDGLVNGQTLGGYAHFDFGSRPGWAERFVESCRRFRNN